jgi:hypothetical protein
MIPAGTVERGERKRTVDELSRARHGEIGRHGDLFSYR